MDNDALGDEAKAASRTVYALLVSKTSGRALSIVTLMTKRHGLEAWRRLKIEYEGKQGSRVAALLRGVLNPAERWRVQHEAKQELVDLLTSWEKDVARYRMASGKDIGDEVLVATVIEHAPAPYRDLLRMMPQANKATYGALRAYIHEWTMMQRPYDYQGAASPSMDVDQVGWVR